MKRIVRTLFAVLLACNMQVGLLSAIKAYAEPLNQIDIEQTVESRQSAGQQMQDEEPASAESPDLLAGLPHTAGSTGTSASGEDQTLTAKPGQDAELTQPAEPEQTFEPGQDAEQAQPAELALSDPLQQLFPDSSSFESKIAVSELDSPQDLDPNTNSDPNPNPDPDPDPEESITLKGLRFYFWEEVTPASSEEPATYEQVIYDPLAAMPAVPRIEKLAGDVQLGAWLLFSDNSVREPIDLPVTLDWQITGFKDAQGNACATNLATVDQSSGKMTASGTGNGSVTLSCTVIADPSMELPALPLQEISVEISGNVSPDQELHVIGFKVFYQQLTDGSQPILYDPTSTSQPSIETRNGSIALSVRVLWSDGSQQSESAAGIPFSWSIISGSDKATVEDNGLVSATSNGNDVISVQCQAQSLPEIAPQTINIQISGNEPETPEYEPSLLYLMYTDSNTPTYTSYDYANNRIPIISSACGNVSLLPRVLTEPSKPGVPDENPWNYGWQVNWSIIGTTDLSGNPLSGVLATVSTEGVVTATGFGNGWVAVQADIPGFPDLEPVTAKVKIIGNTSYISWMEIVNGHGQPYSGNIFDFKTNDSPLAEFFITAYYSDGSQKRTWAGDSIDGLEWSVSDSEQAVIDSKTGMFTTRLGFEQVTVKATVSSAGFSEEERYASLLVFYAGADGDEADLHSDTLRVRVYFDSDFIANRSDAEVVAEKTLTLDYIQSNFPLFVNQYTYCRWDDEINRPGHWGTMSAYGFSFSTLAADLGVNINDVTGMRFNMKQSVNSSPISASVLLSARYSYPNYGPSADYGNPNTSGAFAVSPIIAIATNRADRENSAGNGPMIQNSCFRLCVGMYHSKDGNDRNSYKWIYGIDLIIKDEAVVLDPNKEKDSDREKEQPQKGPGGEGDQQGGNGDGGGLGGGTGNQTGSATPGANKGSGGDGSTGDFAHGAEAGGGGTSENTYSIHQILSDSQTWLNREDEANPLIPIGMKAAVGCFTAGACKACLGFAGQRRRKQRQGDSANIE